MVNLQEKPSSNVDKSLVIVEIYYIIDKLWSFVGLEVRQFLFVLLVLINDCVGFSASCKKLRGQETHSYDPANDRYLFSANNGCVNDHC
jgi:hypothetical protein